MVNSKHAVFKVNKQTPAHGPPPQAYSTVINCRKPGGKRAKDKKDLRVRALRFAKIPGVPCVDSFPPPQPSGSEDGNGSALTRDGSAVAKFTPTKLRRGKTVGKQIDLDSWFTILTFSPPAQLLEMRSKIASCYRFLRDNPKLWKHSRENYYGGTLPDLPSELTEFQYAHLRHGHGCMSCKTPSTRKTYWAFLRRWCKNCLHSKIIKESDALPVLKDANGVDVSFLQKCLPSGIFDSWGNFVGVGPATTLSYRTVFLASDVSRLVDEYNQEKETNGPYWTPNAWMVGKIQVVDERRQFARKMELWEDSTRQNKSFAHLEKKQARKAYFIEKASQLVPPIAVRDMECCPSYRRAVAIPKEPNMTSWLQLKPKLEKEAADVRARGGARLPPFSVSGSSTPSTDFY